MKKILALLMLLLIYAGEVRAQFPTVAYGYSSSNTTNNGYNQINNHVQDASGNQYMVGRFIGTVDFDFSAGAMNLTASTYQDIFFAKYTSSGALAWVNQLATPSSNTVCTIAIDNSGNLIIAGTFQDAVDFDPGPGTAILNGPTNGDIDIYVAKYDNNGNYIWAYMLTSSAFESIRSLTTDASGNIYIAGWYQGNIDMDAGAGVSMLNYTGTGLSMTYFAKYNSAFGLDYVRGLSGSGNADPASIKLDNSGNIFISGNFQGTVDFDPGAATVNLTPPNAYTDIYLAKYDNTGNYITVKQIGGAGNYADEVYKGNLLIDNSNNIFLCGQHAGMVDFDLGAASFPLTAIITDDFIVKYDQNFNLLWAIHFEGQSSTSYSSQVQIALDNSAANVYAYGSFTTTVDFDPGAGTLLYTACCTNNDTYLGKYSAANGSLQWCGAITGQYIERMGAITVDSGNSIYVTGEYSASIDFDISPSTYTVTGNSVWSYTDFYFGKYNSCTGPPVQPGAISGATTLCSGATATYAVTADTNATFYIWTLPGGWSGTSTTNSITATASASGTIIVTSNNACGPSTSQTLSITINPLPVVTYTETQTATCINWNAITLTPGMPAGGTYSGPGVIGNQFDPAVAGQGTWNIVYTYSDGNGCVDSATQQITVNLCLEIPEADANASIDLFPNPFNNTVMVKCDEKSKGGILDIYDVLGQKVYSTTIINETTEINTTNFAPGIYCIKIRSNDTILTKQIIKQ